MPATIWSKCFVFLFANNMIKKYRTGILYDVSYGCQTCSHINGRTQTDRVPKEGAEENIWA